MAAGKLAGKLLSAVNGGIHRPAKLPVDLSQPGRERREIDVADHHEIDITFGKLFRSRHGAVDEGAVDHVH